MLETVLRTIRHYDMLPGGGRVLCALSGGADSVALLHILIELQQQGALVVAGAAHYNHGLRGADADADEAFCRDLTRALAVPFISGRGDVRTRARTQKRSLEDAARSSRYEFLADAADRTSADVIAVAHTLDDQAETFLLRLLRGAGTRGLGAIRPRAGRIVRPLIEIRREALRTFAADRQLAFREDATNADVAIPRNRVRHELLPYLAREFSPGNVEVLAREAATAREDEDRLNSEAIDLATSIVLTNKPTTVDAGALRRLHPALAARVAREALRPLAGERFVGFEHIRRFLEFIQEGADGAAVSLPGQQAVRQGTTVLLRPEPPRTRRVAGVSKKQAAGARQARKRPRARAPEGGTGSASVIGRRR